MILRSTEAWRVLERLAESDISVGKAAELLNELAPWKDAKFDDACWPGMARLSKEQFMANCRRFHECLEMSSTVQEAEEMYSKSNPHIPVGRR